MFLTVYGHDGHLFNDAERFEQIDNMPLTESPKCNLVKTGQTVSQKFKDYEILYMYITQGQEQITQEDKILIVPKKVCYFDQTFRPPSGPL